MSDKIFKQLFDKFPRVMMESFNKVVIIKLLTSLKNELAEKHF